MSHPRVLLLTNTPAPYRLPVFTALAEKVDLTIMYCQPMQPDRLWEVDEGETAVTSHFLPNHTIPLPGLTLAINPGLSKLLRQIPFDLIIAGENFSHFPAVVTAQQAAKRQGKPFVVWSEAIDTQFASGHFLSNRYRRWLYGRTDAFLAYSEAAKQFLLQRGAPVNKIERGYQVVPTEQLPPPVKSKEELGLAGNQVVLYVGYFNPRKGLPTLLQAFRQVAGQNDRLILVGDGPEKENLRKMATRDGRVIFPGYLDGAEKTSYYAAADLFVLPTLHDPWGLVVNEAMAFGLPIITTTAAGCVELVVDNGRIVPPDDVSALAAALSELLSDPARRAKMGQRSKELIAPNTVAAACDAFLDVIHRCF